MALALPLVIKNFGASVIKKAVDIAGRTTIKVEPKDSKKMEDDKKEGTEMPKTEWIKGVPNFAVLAGAGALAYILFMKPKGRRR